MKTFSIALYSKEEAKEGKGTSIGFLTNMNGNGFEVLDINGGKKYHFYNDSQALNFANRLGMWMRDEDLKKFNKITNYKDGE